MTPAATRPAPERDLLSPLWRHPRRVPAMGLRDWELLLAQARRAGLLARLARLCQDLGIVDTLPPAVQRHFGAEAVWVERQRVAVHWEADCIVRALSPLGTPVVLLKGAAYLMADLPAARARMFNDIDILVPRDRIVAVESALLATGWIAQERDAYNQRYYRQWMHELPPLRHVVRGTIIDVHHTITPPTSRFAVDGQPLLQRSRQLAPGSPLAVLDLPDMVLHSAVHLFQEGEFDHGLRDLLDMDDLVCHGVAADPDFWQLLLQRADELGLQVPLHHALVQLQRLFGTAPPPNLADRVRQLQPNPLARQAMAWLLARALRPMHPSCDLPGTGLARALLYVRSHWLRMPPHLVVQHLVRKAWMRWFTPREPDPTFKV